MCEAGTGFVRVRDVFCTELSKIFSRVRIKRLDKVVILWYDSIVVGGKPFCKTETMCAK